MENDPKPCAAIKGTQVMVSLQLCIELLLYWIYWDFYKNFFMQVENVFYNKIALRTLL